LPLYKSKLIGRLYYYLICHDNFAVAYFLGPPCTSADQRSGQITHRRSRSNYRRALIVEATEATARSQIVRLADMYSVSGSSGLSARRRIKPLNPENAWVAERQNDHRIDWLQRWTLNLQDWKMMD